MTEYEMDIEFWDLKEEVQEAVAKFYGYTGINDPGFQFLGPIAILPKSEEA